MTTICIPKHPKRVALAIKILSAPMPGKMKFGIGAWGIHSGDHAPTERNYCGTTACAWGRIALDRRVQKVGVRVKWVPDYSGVEEMFIKYRGKENMQAAERFFGISSRVAQWLFYPGSYTQDKVTKADVLTRLKKLARGAVVLNEAGYIV